MTVSQFLALSQVGPQVYLYNNATPTPIGATFGTPDNNTDKGQEFYTDQSAVIAYEGQETFLAVVGGTIYHSTNGANTWSGVQALINLFAISQGAHSGLRISSQSGTTKLFISYSGSSTWYTAYSSDGGTTWAIVSASNVVNVNFTVIGDAVFWNGKLYTAGWSDNQVNAEVSIFNPSTNSISVTTGLGGQSRLSPRLCVFNGNLYGLFHSDSNGTIDIWQLVGNSWTNVANLNGGTAPQNGLMQWELFEQGGFMWAIFGIGTTWHCSQIATNLTVTPTSVAIPAAFNSATGRVRVFPDYAANTGSEPQLYIYYAQDGNSTTNWTVWQWNAGALMTLVDTGGSVQDYLGGVKNSQGSTFWQSSADRVDILSRTSATGGIRYSFQLYSSSGTDIVSIRGWQGDNTASYAYVAATLANPSAGTLVGNTVTGLTADNTTVYQVTWSSGVDGFSSGADYQFMLEQF